MSLLDRVNLLQGLNINPISLEIGEGLSDAEILMSIQSKVDKIIDVGNAWAEGSNKYTDSEILKVKKLYEDIMLLVNTGDIVKDGTIDMSKMNLDFLNDLQSIIIKFVHDSTKFVSFSLDNNGYFIADMPDSWNDIIFSTDLEGHLCLDI